MQPDLLVGILSSGAMSGTVLNICGNECQSMCFVNGRPLLHTLQGTNADLVSVSVMLGRFTT